MDLHDWEFLDDGAFLDFHGDPPLPTTQFDMNYFTCPSPNSAEIFQPIPDFTPPRQPARFQLHLEKTNVVVPDPREDDDDLLVKEAADSQTEPPAVMAAETDQDSVSQVFFPKTSDHEFADMKLDSLAEADQDSVSQVFFTKTRENEFADMKLDSPKPEAEEMLNSPRLRMGLKKNIELDFQAQKEVIWEEDNGALKIWKWSLNGIGAICSFGIAAATLCVIVLGSHNGHKHPHHTTHKLRFQIYSDDKRSKMNEALSGVRGVPMSRAQITTGGRYEAL